MTIQSLWQKYQNKNPEDFSSVSNKFADKAISGKWEDAQEWLCEEIAWRIGVSIESVKEEIKKLN